MGKVGAGASEETMMEAYANGDTETFDALFETLAPPIRGFFIRKYGSPVLAEDLLQTTFLNVHRARRDYRVGAPVRPWVFTIAARVGVDEMRRRGRRPEEMDEERVARAVDKAGALQPTPESLVEQGNIAAIVADALRSLPRSQRAVIHLHRYRELTFGEIGEILGTTEGAVKLRAFRVYTRLRQQLASLSPSLDGSPVQVQSD